LHFPQQEDLVAVEPLTKTIQQLQAANFLYADTVLAKVFSVFLVIDIEALNHV
jgi:hypothetical protein